MVWRLLLVGVVSLGATVAYCQEPEKKEPPAKKEGPRFSRTAPEQKPDEASRPFGRGVVPAPLPSRWEYAVHYKRDMAADGDFQAALNKLGAEGWELVGVEPGSSSGRTAYVFKRHQGPMPRFGGMASGGAAFPGSRSMGGAAGMSSSRAGFGAAEAPAPERRPAAEEAPRLAAPQIIPLKHSRAQSLAQLLGQIYGSGTRTGLRLASDNQSNTLVVIGTEAQVKEVLRLVEQLEQLTKEARQPAK